MTLRNSSSPGVRSRISLPAALAAAVALSLAFGDHDARAQTTWISTSNTTFSHGPNWSTGSTPADDAQVVFNASGTANPVVTSPATIGKILFDQGNVTVSGATLSLTGGRLDASSTDGTLTISAPLDWTPTGATIAATGSNQTVLLSGNMTLAHDVTIITDATNHLTISGVMSGDISSFSKSNGGTLTLSNTANTFTGNVTIGAGTLSVASVANSGNASALGAGSTINFAAFSGTTTLIYTGGAASTDRTLKLPGHNNTTVVIDSSGSGPLSLTGGFTDNVSVRTSNTARTLTLTGTTLNNTISSAINDSTSGTNNRMNVAKTGTGSWILSGTNNYTGTTTVSAGTLFVNGSGSIGAGSAVTVSGGSLGGTGTINGATTIASGGTLAPGASPGVLRFSDTLTLNSGSVTTFEINGRTTRGTDFDGINVGGLLTYGGTLNLSFSSTIANSETPLNLFQLSGGSTGSFDAVSASGIYSGSFTNNSGSWTLTSGGQLLTFSQSSGGLSFAASAIPEPASFAALLGVAAIGSSLCRRRRRAWHGGVGTT